MMSDPSGVLVASVVENSPADIAGVLPGDILVSADTGGEKHALKWPSEWRAIELAATAGTAIDVEIDRAEEQRRAHIVTVARVHTPARDAATKLREEQRAGIVVRAATEVEARAAGLGPGGGAVVVGLSQTSPWRRDGIRFGDLVRSVNGTPVAHPEVLLEAIRAAPSDGELDLEIVRAGSVETVVAHLTRRESEIKHITIPILFSYDKNRGQTEWSFLFGLLSRESNAAAWRMSFLWFFSFSGGDADRLEVLRS
jgi:C-terminal processing protease CtpA/Prc